MGIVQQNSGTWTGAGFTATLPGASSASNTVAVMVAGNTTITTPGSWNLRTSQVDEMGHYLIDRGSFSLSSIAVTTAAGQGTWWIFEVNGAYDTSTSAHSTSVTNTYTTPTLTPTAGTRTLFASLAQVTGSAVVRTISGWTSSFVEQVDLCQASADYPMQGGAALEDITASGSTGYSTSGTYSGNGGRSAIIASYVSSAGGAPSLPPIIVMPPRRY